MGTWHPSVAIVAIASPGPPYDALAPLVVDHFLRSAPPTYTLVLLYGDRVPPGAPAPSGHRVRVVAAPFPDTLVPGVLDKTVWWLGRHAGAYEYVVRTNLSSWYHWEGLDAYLRAMPGRRAMAGYAPDASHASGCNLILTSDLAAALGAATDLDRGLVDDLAFAAWARARGLSWRPVGRLDLVYEAALLVHEPEVLAFHVRLKHADRAEDPAWFRALADQYDPEQPAVQAVLRAARARRRPLLLGFEA